LNWATQLLLYANDVSVMGENEHTIKNKTVNFLVANKEDGIEVSDARFKQVSKFLKQNAEQNHKTKMPNNIIKNLTNYVSLKRSLLMKNAFTRKSPVH
jgi:hypothetical protein